MTESAQTATQGTCPCCGLNAWGFAAEVERLRVQIGQQEREIEILRNGLLTIAGARNKYVGGAGAFINALQDTAKHVLGN